MNTAIKLSPEFKTETTKTIIAISFFAFTYLLILLFAVGLTIICMYSALLIVGAYTSFITIFLGLGLASLGVLIIIFLLKFFFKSHKVDRSHLYEISRAEEPELFKLIDELVKEIGTSFPRKVYLSNDVNASVFYDSSFWSMFLPVKKNLQIGMGLVNTITKTELKAILSHEFGHFSQKTMKVGSHVYHVNQVIFNLLYENESYDKIAYEWASASGYFSIFVVLAIKIIAGIQWILKKMYGIVNKSYLGLSREMEFHADEIAAHVTGFEPLKSSLLRMSLADHSFNQVMTFYDGKITGNIKSENLYKEHLFVMNFIARDNNTLLVNNLPEISEGELNKYNKSKLVIKDQWSSHPSTEERIRRLEESNISTGHKEETPANEIFQNPEETQRKLTEKAFEHIQYTGNVTSLPIKKFEDEFKEEFSKNTFSKVYNGYYDNKNPILFDIKKIGSSSPATGIEDLYSDEIVDTVYTAIALQSDIETLRQIADKSLLVKTFDYDGKKYKRKESAGLLPKLTTDLNKLNEEVKQNDINIYNFFKKLEQDRQTSSGLENLYKDFFAFDNEFDAKYEVYINLSNALNFLNTTTPIEQIKNNFRKIEPMENKLKKGIRELLADEKYGMEITKEIRENLELYLTKEWRYFGQEKYFDNNLEILFSAMGNYALLLSKGYFLLKKKLLEYQLGLLQKAHLITSKKESFSG